jgi:hypothetical protein
MENVMKFAMRNLMLAAAATLVAGFAATADAATTRAGVRHAPQATVAAPVDATAASIANGNPAPADHCFYTNYNPATSLGQGSGGSLTLSHLVCD